MVCVAEARFPHKSTVLHVRTTLVVHDKVPVWENVTAGLASHLSEAVTTTPVKPGTALLGQFAATSLGTPERTGASK